MSILNLTLKEASEKLKNKELSPVELTQKYIEASEIAKDLNIYITETFDLALERAQESEKRYLSNNYLSDIDGIPIGVKDIFLTKNIRATNGSRFLSDFIAPYESTVTQKLQDAGYIHMGKVNMDEFAMGSSNITSYFGPVINPWRAEDDKDRVPGGSSGGSAAGVAARSFLGALGTDTGGSIRQPSSYCNLVGMKPTYGTCSRYGIIAFASSLDQAGPMTRTVEDNAILLQNMAGYDAKDSAMAEFSVPNYSEKIGQSIKGLKVGIPKEYYSERLSNDVLRSWREVANICEQSGAEVIDISLPNTEYALAVYYIVSPVEASSNLSRFDGIRYGNQEKGNSLEEIYKRSRSLGWGEEVKRRIILGTNNSLHENFDNFLLAAKMRRLIANDFIEAFKKVDIILTPATTSEAFAIDESPKDPIEMYFGDIFTVTASLAGVPAISVPAGFSSNNLPIGMQLVGKYRDEATLYQAAYIIEDSLRLTEVASFVKNNKLI